MDKIEQIAKDKVQLGINYLNILSLPAHKFKKNFFS